MFECPDNFDRAQAEGVVEAVEAIARSRLRLVTQGVHVVTDPERILYKECLARVAGLDGRIHGAHDFVPHLDVSGKTPVLDRHVLTLVLDRLESDSRAVLGCNLSAGNFFDSARWAGVLKQLHARPHLAPRLVLEVTEAQALRDLSLFAEMIAEVRALGCRVAMDDFGAGFASPRVLQLIDFDIVKIDKSFISDVRYAADGCDSIASIVGLASCFAPVVVVEGIETSLQAERAHVAGATHLQGFFCSIPDVHLAAAYTQAEVLS